VYICDLFIRMVIYYLMLTYLQWRFKCYFAIETKLFWLLDVPSGIAMDSEFRISGGCERSTGAINLMEGPVPHAQPRVKTGLSATAVGSFGLDTGLFMRSMATMRFMAKTKTR